MAIIVEDGTGKPDAVSYIGTSFADSYHAARGRTDWGLLDLGLREAACVRATDYIELRFGPRFRGVRISPTQGLQWPRLGAFDNSNFVYYAQNAIPNQLKKACAEYALISARSGELAPNPPLMNGTQTVATGASDGKTAPAGAVDFERSIVGPLEREVRYVQNKNENYRMGAGGLVSAYNLPEYPEADLWLTELIRSTVSSQMVRA